MQDPYAEKTCFISAASGTDLSVLTAVLERHGYRVIAPTSFGAGQRWLDVLTESLRTVDLVIGVLSSGGAVANAMFELGYALGIGKRALIVVSPKADDLPFALSELMVVRAEPTDYDAIEFALESLPATPLQRSTRPMPHPDIPTLTENIDEYVQRVKSARSEDDLNNVLRALFIDSGVEVVADARVGERRADFAIWSDVLGTYVGNPLIIEIKRYLRTIADVHRAIEQLMSLINAAGASWGLLLYAEGPDKSRIEAEAMHNPTLLVLSLDELLEHLRTRSFFDIIRDLRNRKVHGVGH